MPICKSLSLNNFSLIPRPPTHHLRPSIAHCCIVNFMRLWLFHNCVHFFCLFTKSPATRHRPTYAKRHGHGDERVFCSQYFFTLPKKTEFFFILPSSSLCSVSVIFHFWYFLTTRALVLMLFCFCACLVWDGILPPVSKKRLNHNTVMEFSKFSKCHSVKRAEIGT